MFTGSYSDVFVFSNGPPETEESGSNVEITYLFKCQFVFRYVLSKESSPCGVLKEPLCSEFQ